MCAPMFASFLQSSRCARPCTQVLFPAQRGCADNRKFFVRPSVGRPRSAPSHRGRWWLWSIRRLRKGIGDRSKGNVVGAPWRAQDRVIREGRSGPRRPLGKRCPHGCPLSHRCAPWCARLGVEGYTWECRRRRVQCSDAASGVRGMVVGPPRSRRTRLRAIRYGGGSGVAAVFWAQLMTYDGR